MIGGRDSGLSLIAQSGDVVIRPSLQPSRKATLITDNPSHQSPIDELAESFARRLRRGERPLVEEYVGKYPELADAIRDVFPAIEMVEGLAPALDESSEEPTKQLGPLDRLGDYRIIREIGRGGMGVVYEAEQESLRRRVAIKVFPTAANVSTTQLQRFYREAQSAASLHHTNIVPVFEVGNRAGVHFYAMQFIHGQDLDEVFCELKRLRQIHQTATTSPAAQASELAHSIATSLVAEARPVNRTELAETVTSSTGARPVAARPTAADVDTSVELLSRSTTTSINSQDQYYLNLAKLGLQVAEALAYAHGQNILHRDIKPANLLLDTAGTVWVTDFGLAKLQEHALTQTGDIVGTFRYMAPERFQGQGDERSDIYGLGVTLYELATLREPFPARDRAELVRQIEHVDPVPPRRAEPRVPRDFETIILKAMEKEPARRYRHASQLADDLRLFLADKPVNARRVNWLERCWRWCRRNKMVASLAASVAALVLMVAVISSISAVRLRALAATAQAENKRATRGLFDSYLDQAQARRYSQRPGQRIESLRSLEKAAALLDRVDFDPHDRESALFGLRSDIISSLSLFDLREVRGWEMPAGWEHPQFDWDYKRYAINNSEGAIQIRSCDDNRLLDELPGEGVRAWELRFSPRGKYLAAKYHEAGEQNRFVKVWNAETGELVLREAGTWAGFYAFSHDGRLFANATDKRHIQLYALSRPRDPPQELATDFYPDYLRFRPDGAQLVATSYRSKKIALWDLADESQRDLELDFSVQAIGWTGDSDMVAMGCSDTHVRLWPADDLASEPRILRGHHGHVIQTTFDDSGQLLVSKSWDGSQRVWDVPRGVELFRVNGERVTHCSFAGASPNIGFNSGHRFGVWEFGQAGEMSVLSSDTRIRNFAHHPTLPVIAVATEDGFQLWNLQTKRLTATYPNGFTFCAIFAPDGSQLYTSGELGVQVWPVSGSAPSEVAVGPPRVLLQADELAGRLDVELRREPAMERLDLDASGRWMSVDCGAHVVVVLDLAQSDSSPPLRLICHKGPPEHQGSLNYALLTPDAKWVVTATWQGTGVWVWDAVTGELHKQLVREHGSAIPAVSQDGRWLAVAAKESLRIWDTKNWELAQEFPREQQDWRGTAAFSPDGSLCVHTYNRRALQVRALPSGKRLAIITNANHAQIGQISFSPDGSALTAVSGRTIVQWNLSQIRERLKTMALDWETATY